MNITKTMQEPVTLWKSIFDWIRENTIVFASIALAWKGLTLGFKYLNDGRRNEIVHIIEEELSTRVTPEITKLSTSIDELKEAIWALKNSK